MRTGLCERAQAADGHSFGQELKTGWQRGKAWPTLVLLRRQFRDIAQMGQTRTRPTTDGSSPKERGGKGGERPLGVLSVVTCLMPRTFGWTVLPRDL